MFDCLKLCVCNGSFDYMLANPETNPLIAPVETVAKLLDVEPYPINSTFVVAGVSELCGELWIGDPESAPENIMDEQEDGTYIKVYKIGRAHV